MINFNFKFKDNTKNIVDLFEKSADEALKDVAEYLLKQANQTVPFDTGQLKQSGVSSVDKRAKESAVSYNTDYAVRVHESTGRRYRQKGINISNPRVTRRRRAKWLELTWKEKKDKVGQRMQKIFRKNLR